VATLCRHLDGLPLAIELAAARVRALPVGHIAASLDDRFRLLVGRTRTAPARQQTLRATLDWSYDLLDAKERVAFQQLSVFAGGCSLKAAGFVASRAGIEGDELVDLVSGLVDKSMLTAEPDAAGGPRYGTLESLRITGVSGWPSKAGWNRRDAFTASTSLNSPRRPRRDSATPSIELGNDRSPTTTTISGPRSKEHWPTAI
jgi:hypothetical protein